MQHKRRKKEGDNDSKNYDDTGEERVVEKKSTELLRAVSSASGEDDKPTTNASKVKQKTKNGKKPNWYKLRKKGHDNAKRERVEMRNKKRKHEGVM